MGRASGQDNQTAVLDRRSSDRPTPAQMKVVLGHASLLKDVCAAVWAADTSAGADEWSESNPSWGQCAVTSLLVQDFCGGELMRTTIQGISHYFNRLPDGTEMDLTRQQFGDDQELDIPAEPRERDYVLSYQPTAERYELLRERALEKLGIPELKARENIVLNAIKAAGEKTEFVDLSWVVEYSKLSGSICERTLTALRKAGLAESAIVAGTSRRSWQVTPAGQLALDSIRSS